MIRELVEKNRSYRRFDGAAALDRETLRDLVGLARLAPSAANLQPLKYLLSWTPETNASIFPHLAWAGYLEDWDGPEAGERPTGYIVILADKTIAEEVRWDHGIAAQTILLGAAEKGFGGCMIASVERGKLREALALPDRYEILLVVALGRPAERVIVESVGDDGDIRYWRDETGIHHVPKRPLDDLILE
ncbi:MAG: nitroreductase family protein [Candidatus Eisenbacteria bacterium]|nr:nitroreductase family protein [Candidatus Eisenbacteria bacterium]